MNLPRGHVHINAFMSERDYNFSHRINKFSFGDPSPGIVHPLEGDEVISNFGKSSFFRNRQYCCSCKFNERFVVKHVNRHTLCFKSSFFLTRVGS